MTAAIVEPFRIEHHQRLPSTNDEAMRRLASGERGRFVVTAAEQTGGRGRHGRTWHSPPGNLYASVALRNPCAPQIAPQLGFVAGMALADALREALGGDGRLRLKWPNDALFDGAKIAGMLLEGSFLHDGSFGCVIGVGVNCRNHPHDLPYRATDLRAAGAARTEPANVLLDFIARFDEALLLWDGGRGFETVRRRWLDRAEGLGAPIAVATPRGRIEGTFTGLDASGRLLVSRADDTVTVDSGDVTIHAETASDL